jgi:hypothetical protein
MNGKKARELRKKVYPFSVTFDLRDYYRMADGSIRTFGFRAEYQKLKKRRR